MSSPSAASLIPHFAPPFNVRTCGGRHNSGEVKKCSSCVYVSPPPSPGRNLRHRSRHINQEASFLPSFFLFPARKGEERKNRCYRDCEKEKR